MNDISREIFIFLPNVQKKSGVYRYCIELLDVLKKKDPHIRFSLVFLKDNIIAQYLRSDELGSITLIEKSSFGEIINFFKESKIGTVHLLTPDLRGLILLFFVGHKTKIVVTVHDAYSFHSKFAFNQWRSWGIEKMRSALLRIQLRKANRIIAISQNTKEEIIKFLNLSDDIITVIYSGVSNVFQRERKGSSDKYLGRYLLMNYSWANFFPIFKKLLKEELDLKLVCFRSDPSYKSRAKKEIEKLGLGDRVILMAGVSDGELADLYSNAVCFIRYVDYEGFGMPVVEAMACGCPVLVSKRGSLPEIVRIPELVIDFEDHEHWLTMLRKISRDDGFRARIKREELMLVGDFDWNKTAEKTIEIYDSI